jgi:hypothetical protein
LTSDEGQGTFLVPWPSSEPEAGGKQTENTNLCLLQLLMWLNLMADRLWPIPWPLWPQPMLAMLAQYALGSLQFL